MGFALISSWHHSQQVGGDGGSLLIQAWTRS
jgi:hypothetical protein